MTDEKKTISKKVKAIIAILLALLILSAGALAVRVVYLNFFQDNTSTMVVPDNLIGEDGMSAASSPDSTNTVALAVDHAVNSRFAEIKTVTRTHPASNPPILSANSTSADTVQAAPKDATVIELYKGQPSDNEKFQVRNMLPGDSETKYYAVKVNHRAEVVVYFDAVVTEQTKRLADVLHIKVTRLDTDTVLYDGAFAGMKDDGYGTTLAASGSTETVAYYMIEASMPTSSGNEYQAASLLADFHWTVKDTELLDPPQTGDNSNIMRYFIIAHCALVLIILLLVTKRRGREVDERAS